MSDQHKSGVAFVDNVGRRTWDKEEYEKRAKDRLEEEEAGGKPRVQAEVVLRAPLKARETLVDLTKRLGKSQVITPCTPMQLQGGYYCDVCECLVKDSSNYLDHINGKKHTRALGMSLRPERATLEQVRKALQGAKKKLLEKSKPKEVDPEIALEQRLDKLRKEEEEERVAKKQRRITHKAHEDDEADPELAAAGLPFSFGTSAKGR